MSCGIFSHVDVYSSYNPYDHRDVYECQRCGRVTTRDAGPVFRHDVTLGCCDKTQEWSSATQVPAFSVGDQFACEVHGAATIRSIRTTQVKGKPVTGTRAADGTSSTPEVTPGVALFASVAVGLVFGLFLGWIPMLVLGGPYLVWVLVVGFFVGIFTLMSRPD